MNERDLVVLEQYPFTVKQTYRGRGSYICVTDRGLMRLQEYGGGEKRARLMQQLQQHIREKGYRVQDVPVANGEGNVVSMGMDGRKYIVTEWMDGRECDVSRKEDLYGAVTNLARLHQVMEYPEKTDLVTGIGFLETADKHNRELRKIRSYIRAKKQKTDFEQCFLQYFSVFYEKGLYVHHMLGETHYEDHWRRAVEQGIYRHGEYTQHNVLFTVSGTATVHFEHFTADLHSGDLAHFLRKVLEKYDWDETLGMELFHCYNRIRPLSEEELSYLRLKLSYPEKVWKLMNRYYNANKSWLVVRSTAKLVKLMEQETKKEAFIKCLV